MRTLSLKQGFNLQHTLECGQFFRWEKVGNWYYVVARDTLMKVRQEGNTLQYSSNPDKASEFMSSLFRLDDDLEKIRREISKDGTMQRATSMFRGMRLMRQEPFECLISYVCSANSAIPCIRIKLNKMSELYGGRVELDGYSTFTFPRPETLARASVANMRSHRLGFHSDYIKEVAQLVESRDMDLSSLSQLCYEDAKGELLRTFGGKGVGEKVADCTLLFSLDKLEAFPIDVWVERAMRETYFGGKKVMRKDISKFAREYFGRYAGYAQEYLYHYRRGDAKEACR